MRPAVLALVAALGGCADPTAPTTGGSTEDLYARYDDGFEALLAEATTKLGREVLVYEPIAPGLLAKRITISGSPRELGHLVGWMARRWGIEPARRTPASADVNERITRAYGAVYPAFLDEAAGVAQACDLSVDALDLRDLEPPAGGAAQREEALRRRRRSSTSCGSWPRCAPPSTRPSS